MARRVLRLEPPYLISIALVLVLWQASTLFAAFQGAQPTWSVGQILSHFFYLVPLTQYGWLQPVYWSLAWEFVFYISMGLMFPLIGKRESRAPWYLVVVTALTLVSLSILPDRTLLFILGIAVYRAGLEAKGTPTRFVEIAVIIVSAAVLSLSNKPAAIVGGAAALLIHARRDWTLPRVLHTRLIWLGGISYSLYLTHVPVGGRIVNLGRRFVAGPLAEALLSLVALACCVTFAWLFFRLIEKPSIAFAKRVVGRSRSSDSPAGRREATPVKQAEEGVSPGS